MLPIRSTVDTWPDGEVHDAGRVPRLIALPFRLVLAAPLAAAGSRVPAPLALLFGLGRRDREHDELAIGVNSGCPARMPVSSWPDWRLRTMSSPSIAWAVTA